MSIGLVMPTLAAVAFGSAAGVIRWRVRPWIAMRHLAAIGTATAATVFLILSIGAFGLLAQSALDRGPMVVARHSLGGALAGGHQYPLVHPHNAVADLIAMAAAASVR